MVIEIEPNLFLRVELFGTVVKASKVYVMPCLANMNGNNQLEDGTQSVNPPKYSMN